MTLLADWQILAACRTVNPMISPVSDKLSDLGVVSYGVSSYGYDARLGDVFKVYRSASMFMTSVLDPTEVSNDDVDTVVASNGFVIPPKGFVLAKTMEYFRIPPRVTALVKDKSTYARCGIHVQNTVLEAGWEGEVTLEISNYLNRPVLLRPGQGIVQILFHTAKDDCSITYGARGGKYMGQTGVTLPKMKMKGSDSGQIELPF